MNPDMLHATRAVPTLSKTFTAETAPVELLAFAALIVPRLLAGDDPTMKALRGQYERAVVQGVELAGSGFFVDYDVPGDVPGARPLDLTRGDVKIPVVVLGGVPEGCRVFVYNGRLASFEGIMPADGWLENEKSPKRRDRDRPKTTDRAFE